MAKILLVLLVLGVLYVNCAKLHSKAFYCRDPDTGKLHAVNSTWTSSSFCGNYTCNIRRKNGTLPSTDPIRQFNFTNIPYQITNTTEKAITVTIEKKIEPDIEPLLHKIVNSLPRNMIQPLITERTDKIDEVTTLSYNNEQKDKSNTHNCNRSKVSDLSADSDRFLTEKEIDNITNLLHTVKRSDLDAIVDIYKLAQDIYKEIDEISSDEIKSEALNILRDEEIHKTREVGGFSYWYDPLLSKGNGNGIASVAPKISSTRYFTEGLLGNNVKITPFYYPVTQFQRISSYTHPAYSPKASTQIADTTKRPEVIRQDIQNKNKGVTNKADSRKLIEPTHYLPYPFTNIHPYNVTETRNNHYNNPWILDYYNRYKYYNPYHGKYKGPVQRAVLLNPHLHNEIQDVEVQSHKRPVAVEAKNENKGKNRNSIDTLLNGPLEHNWKTGPIPKEVLKEIRADIDTTKLMKAFPFRRKVKLERVGKLMNVDNLNSHVNRNKRFVSEEVDDETAEVEEYETYLGKVTCRDQVELGYFRIGNLTLPYPECCPQLIDTR